MLSGEFLRQVCQNIPNFWDEALIDQSSSTRVCRWGGEGRGMIRERSSHLSLSESYTVVIQQSWLLL